MLNILKSKLNSLPSIITAIVVGLFVSWIFARAAVTLPGGFDQVIALPPSPPPASLVVSPSVGTVPLNGVDVTVSGGGSSGDTYVYSFNCIHGDGSLDMRYPASGSTATSPYTAADLCNYPSAGTYTVLGDVTRYHTTSDGYSSVTNFALTTTVIVSDPGLPVPPPPPLPAGPLWLNPTQNPPGGNAPPPLDTGSIYTDKSSSLNLFGFLVAKNIGLTGDGVTNALIIQPGKNVGFGTTNPQANVDIRGTVSLWGSRESKAFNTNYTPTSDGLVVVAVDSTGGAKCQASGGPGTEIVDSSTAQGTLSFPAIKGQVWNAGLINLTSGTGSCSGAVYYYPFGTGTSVAESAGAGGAGTGTTPPPPTGTFDIPTDLPGTFAVPPQVLPTVPPPPTFSVPPQIAPPRISPGTIR